MKRIFAYCFSIPMALSGCGGCDDSESGEGAAPAAPQAWVSLSGSGAGADFPMSIAMDSGSIYVAGWETVGGTDQRWRIEKRDRVTGAMQYEATSNPSTGRDQPFGVAIDSEAMYVVGCDEVPGERQWRIEKRRLSDGALVQEFGIAGVVQSNPSSQSDEEAFGIALSGSSLFVVGKARTNPTYTSVGPVGGDSQWRIERRDAATGALLAELQQEPDSENDSDDAAYAVAVAGEIVYVAGVAAKSSNFHFRVESYNFDLKKSQAVLSDPGERSDGAYGIAVDGSALYVVGYDHETGTDGRWRIEKRRLSDLELEFVQTINQVSDADDSAYACFLHGGSLFVVGDARSALGDLIWKVEELDTATGSLVTSRSIDPSLQDDYVTGGVADDTGLILIGSDGTPLNGNSYWRIERVLR